jgi:hypothetical protein
MEICEALLCGNFALGMSLAQWESWDMLNAAAAAAAAGVLSFAVIAACFRSTGVILMRAGMAGVMAGRTEQYV